MHNSKKECDIDIIDIEASGLHFDSYPIEIAVLVNKKYHSWLIKPVESWTHWCEKAEALHGISRAQLFEEGSSVSVVAEKLSEVLADGAGVIYSDADRWDEDWLSTLFYVCDRPVPVKVLSIFDLMSKCQMEVFNSCKSELCGSNQYQVHRALSDVKIIERSFIHSFT